MTTSSRNDILILRVKEKQKEEQKMKLKTKWKIDYQNTEYNTFAQMLYGLMKLMLPDFWTRKTKTNPLNRSRVETTLINLEKSHFPGSASMFGFEELQQPKFYKASTTIIHSESKPFKKISHTIGFLVKGELEDTGDKRPKYSTPIVGETQTILKASRKDEWYFGCNREFTDFLKFLNYLREDVLVERPDLLEIVDDIEAEFKIYLEQLPK